MRLRRLIEVHFRDKRILKSTSGSRGRRYEYYEVWDVLFMVRTLSTEKEIEWQNVPKNDHTIQSYAPHWFRSIYWYWCAPIIFVMVLLHVVLSWTNNWNTDWIGASFFIGVGLGLIVEGFFGYRLGPLE